MPRTALGPIHGPILGPVLGPVRRAQPTLANVAAVPGARGTSVSLVFVVFLFFSPSFPAGETVKPLADRETKADQCARDRGPGRCGGGTKELQSALALHAGQGPQRGHDPATTSLRWRTLGASTWRAAGSACGSTITPGTPK